MLSSAVAVSSGAACSKGGIIIVGDEETEDTRKNSTVSLSKSQLRKMVRVVTV